ncbi:hypothetical protein TorRG33x02_173790, partial [Trema orientale]
VLEILDEKGAETRMKRRKTKELYKTKPTPHIELFGTQNLILHMFWHRIASQSAPQCQKNRKLPVLALLTFPAL